MMPPSRSNNFNSPLRSNNFNSPSRSNNFNSPSRSHKTIPPPQKIPFGLEQLLNKMVKAVLSSRPLHLSKFYADILEAELDKRTMYELQLNAAMKPPPDRMNPLDRKTKMMAYDVITGAAEEVRGDRKRRSVKHGGDNIAQHTDQPASADHAHQGTPAAISRSQSTYHDTAPPPTHQQDPASYPPKGTYSDSKVVQYKHSTTIVYEHHVSGVHIVPEEPRSPGPPSGKRSKQKMPTSQPSVTPVDSKACTPAPTRPQTTYPPSTPSTPLPPAEAMERLPDGRYKESKIIQYKFATSLLYGPPHQADAIEKSASRTRSRSDGPSTREDSATAVPPTSAPKTPAPQSPAPAPGQERHFECTASRPCSASITLQDRHPEFDTFGPPRQNRDLNEPYSCTRCKPCSATTIVQFKTSDADFFGPDKLRIFHCTGSRPCSSSKITQFKTDNADLFGANGMDNAELKVYACSHSRPCSASYIAQYKASEGALFGPLRDIEYKFEDHGPIEDDGLIHELVENTKPYPIHADLAKGLSQNSINQRFDTTEVTKRLAETADASERDATLTNTQQFVTGLSDANAPTFELLYIADDANDPNATQTQKTRLEIDFQTKVCYPLDEFPTVVPQDELPQGASQSDAEKGIFLFSDPKLHIAFTNQSLPLPCSRSTSEPQPESAVRQVPPETSVGEAPPADAEPDILPEASAGEAPPADAPAEVPPDTEVPPADAPPA